MLTGWDSNKKVRIRPGKQLIPSALADITLPVHLNSSSGVYGKDMAAMFSDLDPVDPHWSSVVLAMPMDGANGSTTFTDLKGKAVTRYGNTVISTAQSKFGGASAYFDGAGDYLTVPVSDDFRFLAGDFCIEFWVYPMGSLGVGNRGLMGFSDAWNTAGQWLIDFYNYFDFVVNTEGTRTDYGGVSVSLGTWQHVAFVRNGINILSFLNGTLVRTSPLPSISHRVGYGQTTPLNIGKLPWITNVFFQGYIDDLRITKGAARYTANFTPPTRSIATTSPTYSGLNPLAKKIALEIGDTGAEVPISILTQDWDNADNTAEDAKIYAVFEDLEDGNDFTLYWDSTHADNTNVTEISSAPAAPGSGDALTVWNLASTDDLWLIATEFYTISGTVTVSAVAASRRVVVFDESRVYQSFFSDASDGSYGCFVPSTGPFNIAMIGNAGEYPKIFSGVTAV